MTLGNQIAHYRKARGLTQENLAKSLGVTNQAVSKWEQDICCPDIQLLPRLADLFEVSLDALFDRETPDSLPLPWEDDGALRAVIYVGHKLVMGHPAGAGIEFQYEGPALNVHSQFNITCDNVQGGVHAAGNVTCDGVGADVHAGGSVTCDSVYGNVSAGGNVNCDEIFGTVQAGGNIYCDHLDSNPSSSVHLHFD